jgi:hypothetical protein
MDREEDGIEPDHKRRKGWVVPVLLVLGCVLVAVVLFMLAQVRTRTEIEQELAQLKERRPMPGREDTSPLIPGRSPTETMSEESVEDTANAADVYCELSLRLTNNDELTYIRSIDRLADAARLPYYEGRNELDDLTEEAGQTIGFSETVFSVPRYPFANGHTAETWRQCTYQAEHEVGVAQARTVLSLRQYESDHGTYPDTLEALVPDHLDGTPIDSFSGEPLNYRRDADGFVLYSVGIDQLDNNGTADTRFDGDIVWRMDH